MTFRSSRLLAALTLMTFAPGAAMAGNVLLPNDNGDHSTYPNLGLMPAESTPATAPPAISTTTPPTTTPAPAPVQISTSKAAPTATQAPAATTSYPTVVPQPAPISPPIMPTTYKIIISLSPTPSFSATDSAVVSTQLGLPAASVSQTCRYGIAGNLVSDKGFFPLDSNGSPSVTVGYDGTVVSADVSVYAVCTSAPQLAKGGYARQVGNVYVLPMKSVFCAPKHATPGSSRTLNVTYANFGNAACAFTD